MTFTTIPNEHFITLSVNFAVNMTVICLLACTFFLSIKCPWLHAVNNFFTVGWKKDRSSKWTINPSQPFDLLESLWTCCWMLIITNGLFQFEIQQPVWQSQRTALLFREYKLFYSDKSCKELLYLKMSLADAPQIMG